MARVKVVNTGQNQDLIGGNFTNDASKTIFNLGEFVVESNFVGRKTRDYSNELSSFVKPITLETLGLTTSDSENLVAITENVSLNLDNSDLKSFIKYGSSKEFVRISIQNIILAYPSSLFASTQTIIGGNNTITDFSYNDLTNISTFKIPSANIVNEFEMIFNDGNTSVDNDEDISNLNISYSKYVIWDSTNPTNNINRILEFTGDTTTNANITVVVEGNPFPSLTGTTGAIDFHLKPNPLQFNKFISNLSDIEKYFLSNRLEDQSGFIFEFKNPTLLETGEISYSKSNMLWNTSDGYNIDISGAKYSTFLDTILIIGNKYDEVKTDLVARFLTPAALKIYDTTDEGKMTKLLRVYGAEFDKLKEFVDSLVYINRTSYDKKNNIPDTLVKNLAKTLGWDVFTLVTEKDLVEAFFSTESEYREDELLPAEIDIELWRRIIINTTYFWKTKGTRDAIKSIFLLIGIPEPFINISEYVYTVEGKINPNNVELSIEDLPSASFPFNDAGYPIAPVETNDFYFQTSGNSDSGQAYINNFRNVGFILNRRNDNKKSWVYEGEVERVHYSSPNYYQEASELIINTKEVDVTLDLARAIEYDVYTYNREVDDPLTSTGFTSPYIFINVAFDYGVDTNVFTIPDVPLTGSSIQVSFNGITLTASGATGAGDYYRSGNQEVTLNTETATIFTSNEKDLITLTYLHDKLGSTGYTQVQYVVQVPTVGVGGTTLTLPTGTTAKGDIQLIVDGVTLTKGTSLFTGDFMINPSNPNEIIVQNAALQTYLQTNPVIRIWSLYDDGSTVSNAKVQSEAYRVDTLSGAKLYYNSGIDKYIYVMDVNAFDVESVKITINGLTLQNNVDFTLNPANKKQIYLTNHPIRLGDIMGAYYVVDDTNFIPPLLPADDTFPDIQDMSFLEYLELIQRRLINVRTRKTVSDFNGGYYPTVMNIYDNYMKRSRLSDGDPLQSNGYTFNNLYPFISQYNAFFNRFVNQLLPSTIILRKGGILIRNTSFNRQKHMYRRGVFFDETLQWLGTDGSEFIRPLPNKICVWTDDYICVNPLDPCVNFSVVYDGAIEDAPATTQPTTAPPVVDGTKLVLVGGSTLGTEIYTSADGGASWAKANTTGGYQARTVTFFNETTGIAAGASGTVQRTVDGGLNWTLIGNPVGTKIHADATETFGASDAYWGDTFAMIGGSGDFLFISADNGQTWGKTPDAAVDQLSTGIHMLLGENGGSYPKFLSVSVSYLGSQRILKGGVLGGTTDMLWQDVDDGQDVFLQHVSFYRGDSYTNAVGLAVGDDGTVMNSINAGGNWTNISLAMTSIAPSVARIPDLKKVEYVNPSVAYTVGVRESGVIGIYEVSLFKTTDDGASWIDLTNAITTSTAEVSDFLSMTWETELIGWITIGTGTVLRTIDGGVNWVDDEVPELNGNIYDIKVISELDTPITTVPPVTTAAPGPTTAAPTTAAPTTAAPAEPSFEYEYVQTTPIFQQDNEWKYTWTNTWAEGRYVNRINFLTGNETQTGITETYGATAITVKLEKVETTTDVAGNTTIKWILNGTEKHSITLSQVQGVPDTGFGIYTFEGLNTDDVLRVELTEDPDF